ncbi:MAG TPA: ABC transporter permease [Gemmatimonadaceae bacterium]|nr:ABC transporter permease [Gemmatimonadaceae bacterium]
MSGAARWVALAACRGAARLLPRPFRERYGDELARTVADRVEDAAGARGAAGALACGAREALDIAATAARLRGALINQGPTQPDQSPAWSFDAWRRDLRHAARALAKRPGFLAAAVLTLALGIGANTAIYSLVNGVVLRPLPYERPDRLVMVWADLVREGNHRFSASLPDYRDWRDQSTVFSGAAAQFGIGMRMRVERDPELVRAARVTENFFDVLGARPALGRALAPADTVPGRRGVAVISHALWRRSFASSPAALGRVVWLDGAPYEVVGVMPPDFMAPVFFRAPHVPADIWLPFDLPAEFDQRGAATLQVVARLRDGVALAGARRQLSEIGARLAAAYPTTNKDVGVNLVPMEEQILGELRPSMLTLLGAAGFLLLIACTNVANLFVARALDRRREVAIRLALGAGRAAVIRQFLAEGALVAAAGGALSVAVGWWGMRVLLAFAPHDTVRLDGVRLDLAALGFCLTLTALVGLGVGLAPALRGSRVEPRGALIDQGAPRGSARSGRVRSALVVAQMALAVILLAGAGLMARTLTRLGRVDLGFPADHLLTMRFGMSEQRHDTPERQIAYLRELLSRFERVPGVGSAAFSSRLPLDPAYGVWPVRIEGQPSGEGDRPIVGARVVSDGYFRAMRIPVVAGRDLAGRDDDKAPKVALVNVTFARRFWGSARAAVGRRIGIGPGTPPWTEVVGVAGDVAHDGVGSEPIAEMYVPFAQLPATGGALVVRTTTDPAPLAGAIRRAAFAADPEQALIDVRPMRETADNSVAPRRFLLLLLGAFAGVALALSAVGVYGVLAYVVGQGAREMGIRLALGAQRRDLLLMVARRGAVLAVAGAALGLVGAAGLTRFLERQLYGVSPTDPATLGGVAALLMLVAVAAALVPARRAAAADPVSALRAE